MSEAARPRWRSPPNTMSAPSTRARAAGLRPATPSSPMPTMASQRRGAADAIGLESAMTRPLRVLILGGTTEARRLAERLALRRPAWRPVAGDRWREVADAQSAADALGDAPRRVFLALGRNEIAPFAGAPQHFYLVRSVDAVEPPLAVPRAAYIRARGPFGEEDDRALLAAHEIDVVVAKNSGGPAAYGKIAAARTLGIEVMLLRRPTLPTVASVETVADAVAWLDHAPASVAERGV